jgi:NADH-quinone oxidoreductase subunit G
MGPWDGERASLAGFEARSARTSTTGEFALATWKLLVDNGSMQDGDKAYRATGRAPVARVSRSTYDAVGPTVTLTGDRGSVTLPAEPADLDDGVVWVPANSFGNGVLADLASPGSRVTVAKGTDA